MASIRNSLVEIIWYLYQSSLVNVTFPHQWNNSRLPSTTIIIYDHPVCFDTNNISRVSCFLSRKSYDIMMKWREPLPCQFITRIQEACTDTTWHLNPSCEQKQEIKGYWIVDNCVTSKKCPTEQKYKNWQQSKPIQIVSVWLHVFSASTYYIYQTSENRDEQ